MRGTASPAAAPSNAWRAAPARARAVRIAAVAQTSGAPPQAPPPPVMPNALPLLGHMLLSPTTIFKAAEAEMRARGARMITFKNAFGGRDAVVVRHPDDCAAVTRDGDTFNKKGTAWHNVEEWLGQGLVAQTDPERHAAVKEVLLPAFKAAAVRGFEPLFVQVGEEMADVLERQAAAAGGRPVDARDAARRATLDVIGRAAFGYDFGALRFAAGGTAGDGVGEDVSALYDAILMPAMLLLFDLPWPKWMIPGLGKYHRGVAKLDAVVAKVIAAKRAAGPGAAAAGGDILSFMLAAQARGDSVMTDKQIRDELHTFMLAGSDTTAATLAFALYELSRHPDVAAACAAEADAALPSLRAGTAAAAAAPSSGPDGRGGGGGFGARTPTICAVVSETLRVYPAATEIVRCVARDVVLGGHLVKAGSLVLPSQYSAGRHPDFWPRPDEWLPERWLPANAAALAPAADKAWFPFSSGPRACIGKYFSLLEMQVLLAVVLSRLEFRPVPGYEIETAQHFTLSSRGGALVVPRPRRAR